MNIIVKTVTEFGTENVIFFIPMKPLKTIFGFSYTTSSDPDFFVPAVIDPTSRYKVEENYKITLVSTLDGFGHKTFYISDLEDLIKNGSIKMYTDARLVWTKVEKLQNENECLKILTENDDVSHEKCIMMED